MTVHGADAVDEARVAGRTQLVVGLSDIVTPLARERARDTGIEIVVGSAVAREPSPAVVALPRTSSPLTPATAGAPASSRPSSPSAFVHGAGTPPPPLDPPLPALYRRGAPLPAHVRVDRLGAASPTAQGRSGSVSRVTVVGAGNVGMIAAMRLAESESIDEVVLVDIAGQRAAGIALDIAHAAPILGFSTKIRGVRTLAEAGPSDYVVITAGKARTPGMSRSDLVGVNAAIIGSLVSDAVAVSPDAVLVIVTNPVDEMTEHAWRTSGLPTDRVIGMAGVLDSSRFEALAAQAAGVHPRELTALALGSHGDEMVIPLSQATVSGRPLTDLLPSEAVNALVDRARNSGAEVVGLLESGSAFFAPGLSAARMVLAMVNETHELLTATVAPKGQYGINGGYVGLPVRLGRAGLAEIVEVDLSTAERDDLRTAAQHIRERVNALDGAGSR